jgi:FimV-like protein
VAMHRGRSDEALAMIRQLQQDVPGSPVGFLMEGDFQQQQKKPALAAAAYDKAFAITKSSAVLLRSAQSLRMAGKEDEARQRVAQYAKSHPEDLQVTMFMAEAHLAAKEYKPAAALLEDIIKRAPNNGPALNNLAWAYQQLKDPRALATAEQAVKVAGDNPSVMDTLGWMLVEQGNTQRGLALLQKAAAAAPALPEVRYHLAVALHKSGDKTGARKELESLLAQNKPFAQQEEARSLLKTL